MNQTDVRTVPAVFINCRRHPFVEKILSLQKPFETRTRNTLRRFLGERILLAETGRGAPLVRGSAIVAEIIEVYTRDAWERYRAAACIPVGSEYDWKPDTRKKVLYRLEDVRRCTPFRLLDGIRHGRTWMEAVLPDDLGVDLSAFVCYN